MKKVQLSDDDDWRESDELWQQSNQFLHILGLAFSRMKTFDVRNYVLPELRVETQALVCVTFASHYIQNKLQVI